MLIRPFHTPDQPRQGPKVPSRASRNYDERAKDVALLMGPIREDVRKNPGQRGNPGSRVEVLNRSAIVLVALNWNTPISDRIDSLFNQSLGLEKVTDSWFYLARTADDNRKKIDGWVRLRGSIAHGAGAAKKVTKDEVTDFRSTVKRLTKCTDSAVHDFLVRETGARPF